MRWDIFCRLIDNLGDLGVCWRLAARLAERGQQVRLWVDQPDALAWMAPEAERPPGLRLLHWTTPLAPALLDSLGRSAVWVEAFGCEMPPEFIARQRARRAGVSLGDAGAEASGPAPVWINLEYLSAEPYVARCHGLPSPVFSGPGAGLTKHFFYPGFTAGTGGLPRPPWAGAPMPGPAERQAWLTRHGIPWGGERLVSLFCYEPQALGEALARLGREPTRLLVTAGRASAAVQAWANDQSGHQPLPGKESLLSISYLPTLPQGEFDQLLRVCDLNFVRGEDSLVQALWAARPFVWQLYPQDDQAHHAKLQAFLDWLQPPPDLARFHRCWNGLPEAEPGPTDLPAPDLAGWGQAAQAARQRLLAQDELLVQLLRFVSEKR